MDRKTILAIVISFGIFLAWQEFVLKKYQTQPAPTSQTPNTAELVQRPPSKPTQALATPSEIPAEKKTIALNHGELVITNGAQAIESWSYRTPFESIPSSEVLGSLPQVDLTVDHADYGFLGGVSGKLTQSGPQSWNWIFENEAVTLSREFQMNPEGGFVDLTWKARFRKGAPKFAFVSLLSPLAAGAGEQQDRKLVYMAGDSVESHAAADPAKLTDVLLSTPWIGVEGRYLIFSVVDRADQSRALIQPLGEKGNRLSLVYPVVGDTLVVPVRVYFGPKQTELLKKASPKLVNAIDFGWLNFFAHFILWFMNQLYSIFKNYGAAIIVLTVALKIVLYPLTYKSMKSMKQMAALQPQLQKIRERYANDKEALNREMLNLMKNHGYNPMAGCLPMLIQMPVFFALYRVLYGSFELYRAPFALWITDLSAKDPWYVTPVLLTGVMYFQQKLTPTTATDPAQAKMMQWMPVIFGVFMLGLPSGLTIYMLTNAVVSVIQQVILNRKLGMGSASGVVLAEVRTR